MAVACAAGPCPRDGSRCVDKKDVDCKDDGSPCPAYDCVKDTDKCANVKCMTGTKCSEGECIKVDMCADVQLPPCARPDEERGCRWTMEPKDENGCTYTCGKMVCDADKCANVKCMTGTKCSEGECIKVDMCADVQLPPCARPDEERGCRWTMEPKDENGCTYTCGKMVCDADDKDKCANVQCMTGTKCSDGVCTKPMCQIGTSKKGEGDNYCNTCQCVNAGQIGALWQCTQMACSKPTEDPWGPCGPPRPCGMPPRTGCRYSKPELDTKGCAIGCGKMICDIPPPKDDTTCQVGDTKQGDGSQHCVKCTCMAQRRKARMRMMPDRGNWVCPKKLCPPQQDDKCVVGTTKPGDGDEWCNMCTCVNTGGRHARMPMMPDDLATSWACTKKGCGDGGDGGADADCCAAETKPTAMECGRSGCHCCSSKPARRSARKAFPGEDPIFEPALVSPAWIKGNSGPNMTPEKACAQVKRVPADTCPVAPPCCAAETKPTAMECGRSGCHCCSSKPARRSARKAFPGEDPIFEPALVSPAWIKGNSGPNMTPEKACAQVKRVPADACDDAAALAAAKLAELRAAAKEAEKERQDAAAAKEAAEKEAAEKERQDAASTDAVPDKVKVTADCVDGESGQGTGNNWCNTCRCVNGTLSACTKKGCTGDDPNAAVTVRTTPILTTTLVTAIPAGTTTIAVRDVTGIKALDTVKIGTGASEERATVASVVVGAQRARREQAGSVLLTAALRNDHGEGSSITFERAVEAPDTVAVSAAAASAAAAAAAEAEAQKKKSGTVTAVVVVLVVLIVAVGIVGAVIYKQREDSHSPIGNTLAAARSTSAMQNPQYEVSGNTGGDATYDGIETGC